MNENEIWDYLYESTGSAIGTAAIMGNLMAESSLNPKCATSLKKTGYTTADQYILASDDGVHDFAHDGVAFGLVQWCYHTRKQGFLDYARMAGKSVGDLYTQLEYLVQEMSGSYKTAWNAVLNATSIREASDVIMLRYENPATKTEAMKQRRAQYGQKFYDQFAKPQQKEESAAKPQQKMVVATANVRIRAGDSMDYGKVGRLVKGNSLEYVATSNGFHGVRMKDRVGWVSGEYSEVRP